MPAHDWRMVQWDSAGALIVTAERCFRCRWLRVYRRGLDCIGRTTYYRRGQILKGRRPRCGRFQP